MKQPEALKLPTQWFRCARYCPTRLNVLGTALFWGLDVDDAVTRLRNPLVAEVRLLYHSVHRQVEERLR